MSYNLTESQKDVARFLVEQQKAGKISESFAYTNTNRGPILDGVGGPRTDWVGRVMSSQLDALGEAGLLLVKSRISPTSGSEVSKRCIFTARLYSAVQSNFAEAPAAPVVVSSDGFTPPEITVSLQRFRSRYPDPKKVGFLVMRFSATKPLERIVAAIKQIAQTHGLSIIRADEAEFHADLWGNVRTYLHGCGFGVAIYERIESDEPNANIGLEVGYLMAMNKPVLLLKDKTVAALQADLAGKLYKPFDPHDPEASIPNQLERWLQDNGIILHGAAPAMSSTA